MAAFLREGLRDLSRRLRMTWLVAVRLRIRRKLFKAEVELGWLGWEQADFFDDEINAAVLKVREFEETQASLLNVSAELSGRRAALDKELEEERVLHDQTQAALARERDPIAAELERAEAARRQKLEAAGRFERALEEIADLEKELEALSLSFMSVERPSLQIRSRAREVSDELIRLPAERKLVLADRGAAAGEAARLEQVSASLDAELRRIDTDASAARKRLEEAALRHASETRLLDRERKKSSLHMSRLDREKRKPYRLIGACLADHGIAPMNQPSVLGNLLALREREAGITESLEALRGLCHNANAGVLAAFYLLAAVILIAAFAVTLHLLHP